MANTEQNFHDERISDLKIRKEFYFEPTKLEVLAGMVSDGYRGMVDKKRRAVKKFEDFSDKVAPHIEDYVSGFAFTQLLTTLGKTGYNVADSSRLLIQDSKVKPSKDASAYMLGLISGLVVDAIPAVYALTNGFQGKFMTSDSSFQDSRANETAMIYYGAKIATQVAAYAGRHFKQAYDAKKAELKTQKLNDIYQPIKVEGKQ